MDTARTFIVTVAAFLAVVGGNTVPTSEGPQGAKYRAEFVRTVDVATEATVFAPGDDQELLELGHWAIDRFESAALSVSAIEIHMHRTSEACGGHRGTFNPTANRIDVCVAEPVVVLHEIAHAWAHENLTREQREAFVAVGGFESWNAPETAWSERGSERAATVIAWGLSEQPHMVVTRDGPLAQRNAQFHMLTGFDVRFIELAADASP